MKPVFEQAKWLLVALTLVLGTGCAANNPQWLTDPSSAFCSTGLAKECLQGLAEKSYTEATAKAVKAIEVEAVRVKAEEVSKAADKDKAGVEANAKVAADSKDVAFMQSHLKDEAGEGAVGAVSVAGAALDQPVVTDKVQPKATPKPVNDGSIPVLGYGLAAIGADPKDAPGYVPSSKVVEAMAAGALLNLPAGSNTSKQIKQASAITDPALRAEVLFAMLTLYSRSMTHQQVDAALNQLYSLDEKLYSDSLIIKLPGLLSVGDFERAAALRDILLFDKLRINRPFSMLAYVAGCYSMAGMQQDAVSAIQKAVGGVGSLSDDDGRLILMAMGVGQGDYPPMQDFYEYRSDEVRLQAYLTIAVIARQLQKPDIAQRSVADAVKFIQKASVKVDRPNALAKILAIAPGII
jgi:hypothetical protein